MSTQRTIRRTLLAMAIAAMGASGSALAQADVSGDLSNPQMLQVGPGGVVTVTSSINNPSTSSPDIDYFGFEGRAGETVSVDIDFAHNGTSLGLDTSLFLFSPEGVMVMPGFITDPADSGSTAAPGSTLSRDPTLQFLLNSTGVWKIAVVARPAMLTDDGALVPVTGSPFMTNGPYTLTVMGLTPSTQPPSTQQVNIDIKPGNKQLTRINPKSKGVIPVAILSNILPNSEFNPLEVDVASLRFGRQGNEASYVRCHKDGKDYNADGKPDLVCHFENEKTGFRPGDAAGKMSGTAKGKPFEGRGDLKVYED